jgi:hypothetical protein
LRRSTTLVKNLYLRRNRIKAAHLHAAFSTNSPTHEHESYLFSGF